ncbi:VOC family protein [Nocardioides sp. C4-1]|uniref:VOC family protein n=1 Tax=Nocardioides sp. C4-1 TaxID=3151851 RepID=UPI00326555A6
MTLTTTTHLNFRGDARAALEHYASVFGGQPMITTYADAGMPADVPGADGVLFGLLASPEGFRVMAYDVPGAGDGGPAGGAGSTRRENGTTVTDQPFFVSVTAASLDEAQGFFDRLADGAVVVEPLAASAWSPGFGMLTDRLGVTWAFSVDAGR